MKKISIFVVLIIVVGAFVFFVYAPNSDKYTNTTAANTYSSQSFGFKITLPDGYVADEAYLNQDLGPGKEIPGVAFRIPAALSQGTNLSSDSHVAIEELSQVACTPADFLDAPSNSHSVTLGGNSFITATESGAAAGNLYEETVHVIQKEDRCYSVRYFIHSTNIANYDSGTVKEFDRQALTAGFDSIASSLVLY
jgi:hypothetical protein